jgi:hypothetical protein
VTTTSSPTPEPLTPLATGRHDLRRRLLTVLVLAACAVTVLPAVPDLRPVLLGGMLAYARLRPRLVVSNQDLTPLPAEAPDMPTKSDNRVHRRAPAAPQGRPAPSIVHQPSGNTFAS